jgi:hypothetical protein
LTTMVDKHDTVRHVPCHHRSGRQIIHQIPVVVAMESSKSPLDDDVGAQGESSRVVLIEESLSSCCTELLRRWKSFHGKQDLDKVGSWTRHDPDSNEFMNRLVSAGTTPQHHDQHHLRLTRGVGGIIWISSSPFGGTRRRELLPSPRSVVAIADVQQCCCVIVMLLEWGSRPRATAIVSQGGISCLLDGSTGCSSTGSSTNDGENHQMACLASLLHLVQASAKRILIDSSSIVVAVP